MITRTKLTAAVVVALVSLFAFVWFQEPVKYAPTEGGVREGQVSVTLGDATLVADIAATADERAQGLSGRERLAETEGMLFVFEEDARHSFWMKDMLIAIDMIWLSSDKRVVFIVPNAAPESYPASYSPDDNARYVLEVPAGWAARHGVTVGAAASWK